MTNISLMVRKHWKIWRWWCLAIVITVQMIGVFEASWINADEQYQLGISHAIRDGHNQSIRLLNKKRSQIDISNPARFVSLRQPPGYALIFSSMISSDINPLVIDLVIDLSMTLVFLFAWFLILERIGPAIGVWPRVIFWAVWLIFPSALIEAANTGHSTGFMTVALFSVAVGAGMQVISKGRMTRQAGFAVLAGLVMGLAAVLHYQYWVIAVILPLSWIAYTALYRRSPGYLSRLAVVCSVYSFFVFLFIIPVAVNNHMLKGHITRLNPAASDTVNLEHLAYIIRFPIYSLGFEPLRFTASVSPIPLDLWSLLTVLLLLIIGWNIWLWARHAESGFGRNHRGNLDNTASDAHEATRYIILSGIVTTLVITGFLALVSVQSEVHKYRGGWVPLAELRYYLPVFPFLLLGITLGFSERFQSVNKSWVVRITRVTATAMILLGLSPQVIDRVRKVEENVTEPTKLNRGYLRELLQDMASSSPGEDVVIYTRTQNGLRNSALAANLPAAQVDPVLGFNSLQPTAIIFYYRGPQENWILDSVHGKPITQKEYQQGILYHYHFNPRTAEASEP